MPIHFQCHCGSPITADIGAAGSFVRCPACLEMAEIPGAEAFEAKPTGTPPGAGTSSRATTIDADGSLADISDGSSTKTDSRKLASSATNPQRKISRFAQSCWLFAMLAATSMVQLIPVVREGDWHAPTWMRALLVLSFLQIMTWTWMMLVRDWSSLWIAALVAGAASACYAFALAIAAFAPSGSTDFLEMNDLRDQAQLWLTGMLVLCGAMSFVCGQISFQWRKEDGDVV